LCAILGQKYLWLQCQRGWKSAKIKPERKMQTLISMLINKAPTEK
jgi:hypothetical protein